MGKGDSVAMARPGGFTSNVNAFITGIDPPSEKVSVKVKVPAVAGVPDKPRASN